MLPKYEICRRHIVAYKNKSGVLNARTMAFPNFWNYKCELEKTGQTILDEKNLDCTISRLCALLSSFDTNNDVLIETSRIRRILKNVRPYYSDISQVRLGNGKASFFRDQIESVYERIDNKAGNGKDPGHRFSIVANSTILMTIWGQVPRFDSLNRKRFEKWIHWPAPEKLPYLTIKKTWYRPDEFHEIIVALDRWVTVWPDTNYGKSFQNCFIDLFPTIPTGRLIDIIYHWKLPDIGMDYRLQTGGSYCDKIYDAAVQKYITD